MREVIVITTGGTIDKTYDETEGCLRNVSSVLDEILVGLRLPDLKITQIPLMNKDSLNMTDTDRRAVLDCIKGEFPAVDVAEGETPVHPRFLVVHGTDTLADTGRYLHSADLDPEIRVALTGAVRPFEFRDSDAAQNIAEALFALNWPDLPGGVYAVMHNRLLCFPDVVKDHDRMTFTQMGVDHDEVLFCTGRDGGNPAASTHCSAADR